MEGDLTRLRPDLKDAASGVFEGEGDWVDLSGLIAPHTLVSKMMDEIEDGTLGTLQAIDARLHELHARYYDLEWAWAYRLMLSFYEIDEERITHEDLIGIIRQWKEAVVGLDKMLYEDAKKEFSMTARTGFGFDAQKQKTMDADFEQVRGDFESNTFVAAVTEHIERKTALGDKWLAKLS